MLKRGHDSAHETESLGTYEISPQSKDEREKQGQKGDNTMSPGRKNERWDEEHCCNDKHACIIGASNQSGWHCALHRTRTCLPPRSAEVAEIGAASAFHVVTAHAEFNHLQTAWAASPARNTTQPED